MEQKDLKVPLLGTPEKSTRLYAFALNASWIHQGRYHTGEWMNESIVYAVSAGFWAMAEDADCRRLLNVPADCGDYGLVIYPRLGTFC